MTVDRFAAGAALLLVHRCQHRRLDLGSEALERHHASNHFQRIALRRNRRTANLVVTNQTRTNSRRSLFFEVPFTNMRAVRSLAVTCPNMGVRTRGYDMSASLRSCAADVAARDEARRVVERWNRVLATRRTFGGRRRSGPPSWRERRGSMSFAPAAARSVHSISRQLPGLRTVVR
jgi:hypothetical protein